MDSRDVHELSHIIENIEASSAASFYKLAPRGVKADLGIATQRIGDATALLVRNSRHRYFNRVLALGLEQPATPSTLDAIQAFYTSHGVKRYAIALCPEARPQELGHWLEERGFRKHTGSAKLWRSGAHIDQLDERIGIKVEPISSDRAADWFHVMANVFRHFRSRGTWYAARVEHPGWRHYAVYVDGQVAGIGALYVRNRVAHLIEGATLSAFRRRGIQRSIIQQRVFDGLSEGATHFTSETAPPLPRMPLISYRNLRRVGFELAYVRPSYVLEE